MHGRQHEVGAFAGQPGIGARIGGDHLDVAETELAGDVGQGILIGGAIGGGLAQVAVLVEHGAEVATAREPDPDQTERDDVVATHGW